MRKYYSGITVFKLAGSLLVLLAHIKLPPVYLALTHRLGGLAQAMAVVVPCFYMVSGFLAYKGWAHARRPGHYIRSYLMWVSGVYGLFCTYYLATTTLPDLLTNYRAHTSLASPLHMLFEVFVVKGPVFSLWFVPPLLFGVSVTYLFERRDQFKLVCGLAALGFITAQLTSGSLCALLDSNGYSSFWTSGKHAPLLAQIMASYLGIGFPFVVAGAWVARHEARFQALPVKLLATTSVLVFIGEIWFLTRAGGASHQHFLVLSMAPISLLLFHGVLHLQLPGIGAYHALINRFSMVVFFLHPFLIEINSWLCGWVPYKLTAEQALACVLLTLPETLLFTWLLATYLNRKRLASTGITKQAVLQPETALK
jgi:hypothetical protein